MPDSEPDDDSAADLRARVRDLEATVTEQQETIQKLMPSRRQTIAGLGLLGAGAGVGRLSTERARAQAAGNQGTEEEPNNIWAWDLDVQNGATFNGNPLTGVGTAEVERASIEEVGGKIFVTDRFDIPNDTFTETEFAQVGFEDEIVNTDTSNNQIEVLESGTYEIYYMVGIVDLPTDTEIRAQILVNGSSVAEINEAQLSGFVATHIVAVEQLSGNDTVSAQIRQRSGDTQQAWDGEDRHALSVVRRG